MEGMEGKKRLQRGGRLCSLAWQRGEAAEGK